MREKFVQSTGDGPGAEREFAGSVNPELRENNELASLLWNTLNKLRPATIMDIQSSPDVSEQDFLDLIIAARKVKGGEIEMVLPKGTGDIVDQLVRAGEIRDQENSQAA